jgi:hypothetical protein
VVFVNSKTYGNHVRAARGTYTKVKVNTALNDNANKMALVVKKAKPIYGLLKHYCGDFKETQLWQNLISRMHKSKTDEFFDMLERTVGLDMNSKLPLKRFACKPIAEVKITRQKLHISLGKCNAPQFKKYANSYLYELCVLFLTGNEEPGAFVTAQSPWTDIVKAPLQDTMSFKKPAGMNYYILCFKLQGGRNEKAGDGHGNTGIRIIKAGRLISDL